VTKYDCNNIQQKVKHINERLTKNDQKPDCLTSFIQITLPTNIEKKLEGLLDPA
jgi:hypothetical protein